MSAKAAATRNLEILIGFLPFSGCIDISTWVFQYPDS